MKRRNRRFTTIFSVVALAISLMAVPAFADTNETNCTFSGSATLSSGFPALNGDGSFDGTITCVGTISISGSLTATFKYNEDPAECPLTGDAAGSFSIDGGTYTGDFAWDRVGGTAAITISNVNGPGATNASGTGTAAFEAPPEALECDGDPVTAHVDGAAEIHDTN